MQIGAILPAGDGPDRPANWAKVRDFALSAEQGGLDSVWVFDHLLHESASGRTGQLEGWTTLSAVAAVTERVQVGALVMCSPFRNPVLMAKMAATADEVSGGRLILGLGAGWHAPEFAAMGLSMEQRVDRFDEALPIVTGLLRGERITFAGKHHDVRAAELLPTPTRCIPVLVLDAEGRDPATLTITVGVHVHDPDSGEAPDAEDTVLSGSVDDLARGLEDYAALGVDHLIALPHPHTERTVERLLAARTLMG